MFKTFIEVIIMAIIWFQHVHHGWSLFITIIAMVIVGIIFHYNEINGGDDDDFFDDDYYNNY